MNARTWRVVLVILGGIAFAVVGGQALAHGGRKNAAGCHNERQTGGYHCHDGSSSRGSGGYSYGSSGVGVTLDEGTSLRVDALPRARVYIDGKFAGLSPTGYVVVSSYMGRAKVRVEHSLLGSAETEVEVRRGKRNDFSFVW